MACGFPGSPSLLKLRAETKQSYLERKLSRQNLWVQVGAGKVHRASVGVLLQTRWWDGGFYLEKQKRWRSAVSLLFPWQVWSMCLQEVPAGVRGLHQAKSKKTEVRRKRSVRFPKDEMSMWSGCKETYWELWFGGAEGTVKFCSKLHCSLDWSTCLFSNQKFKGSGIDYVGMGSGKEPGGIVAMETVVRIYYVI